MVVAAILHLGNIEFANGKEIDSSLIKDEKARFHLNMAAELLMCDAKSLEDALIQRVMVTPEEIITRILDPVTALGSRDALAKTIYSRLFNWRGNQLQVQTLQRYQSLGPSLSFCICSVLHSASVYAWMFASPRLHTRKSVGLLGTVVAEHHDQLTASKCPFVVGLFPPLPEESSKSSKFSSIGSRFKTLLLLERQAAEEARKASTDAGQKVDQFQDSVQRCKIIMMSWAIGYLIQSSLLLLLQHTLKASDAASLTPQRRRSTSASPFGRMSCALRASRGSLVKGSTQAHAVSQQALIAHWQSIVRNLSSCLKMLKANYVSFTNHLLLAAFWAQFVSMTVNIGGKSFIASARAKGVIERRFLPPSNTPGVVALDMRSNWVLTAIDQGETVFIALQDAVPEDVCGKLTVAVSEILHNQGTNFKFDGRISESKSKTQENAGGLSSAGRVNHYPAGYKQDCYLKKTCQNS
ncbi:myosin family protein with Dil [Actinidia rufa]|uniref:Myosin family protein with Dil n=1 Tax=Actinidia rufa TaxID=165716 RepID=A0A7J0FIF8_9ERIC|nr:myosin family protein with Dil [Actinidia rufa]